VEWARDEGTPIAYPVKLTVFCDDGSHASEHHWRDRDAQSNIRNITGAHVQTARPASKWCSNLRSQHLEQIIADCAKYRGCTKFKAAENLRAALRFSAKTPLCYSVPLVVLFCRETEISFHARKWFHQRSAPGDRPVLASHQANGFVIRSRPGGHHPATQHVIAGDVAAPTNRCCAICRKFWKPRAAARERLCVPPSFSRTWATSPP